MKSITRGGEKHMPNIVALPEDMKGPPEAPRTVPQGEYGVRVKMMIVRSPMRISALYEVIDEGEFRGAEIWDSFNLEYGRGQEMMSEFLAAIHVKHNNFSLDLDICLEKTLCVTVKHKDDWLNVVSHRPDF
jgi:hypothetical protein